MPNSPTPLGVVVVAFFGILGRQVAAAPSNRVFEAELLLKQEIDWLSALGE